MNAVHDILAFTEIAFLVVIAIAYCRGAQVRAATNDRLHAMSTAINALVTGQQEIVEQLSHCDKISGADTKQKGAR